MAKTAPIPCTKDEIDRLLYESMESDYYFTLFYIAKMTGRRLSEYYDARVEDFDFQRKVLKLKVLKRRMRVVKEAILDDNCVRLLRQFIFKRKMRMEDYLFREKSKRAIQYAVSSYAAKAGIVHKVCFNNFRHYFVTYLLRNGLTKDQVIKFTGHSQISSLAYYDHTIAEDYRGTIMDIMRDM